MTLKRHRDAAFHEGSGNSLAQTTNDAVIFESHHCTLADRLSQDKLNIERLDAEHINKLYRDALLGKQICCLKRIGNQLARADNQHIGALAHYVAFAHLKS